jgi:hypothetical protein
MEKYKVYLHISFPDEYQKGKIDYIPITAGIHISWANYNFDYCYDQAYFPHDSKKGSHIFSISIWVFFWGVTATLYKSKD